MDCLLAFDKKFFLLINGWHNEFWDTVMYWVSNPYFWIPLYLWVVLLFVKSDGKRFWLPLLLLLAAVGLSDFLSVHLFKETIKRLRPCHQESLKNLVHLVKNHCGGKYGFISSHASNTATIFAFVSLFSKKKEISLFLFFWTLLVSYSRVYLGVHFPFDVIGGMLFGSFLGFVFYKFYTLLVKREKILTL